MNDAVAGSGVSRDTELALQILDSVVPDGQASYLAAPISTGRRYYAALAASKVLDMEGLIATIGEQGYLHAVRWPNVHDGETIARRLREASVRYLINTGPIFIREWAGKDYMDLCFSLIERKVRVIYFHPDWAYSAGAVQEYFYGMQLGLDLLTTDNKPLTLRRAQDDLNAAHEHLLRLDLPADWVAAQFVKYEILLREAGLTTATDGC